MGFFGTLNPAVKDRKLPSQCLKITEKVAFNIASEASYVYMSFLIGQKLVENAKIQKFKCDFLSDFQTLCFLFITYFLNGIIN